MKTFTKVLISGSGASIVALKTFVPVTAFTGLDPTFVGTMYGLVMGGAALMIIWPWTRKRVEGTAASAIATDVAEATEPPRVSESAVAPLRSAAAPDGRTARINRRRLHLLISGVISMVSVAYGLNELVPDYSNFARNYTDRYYSRAAGMDTMDGWSKHYEKCMKANGFDPNPFAQPPYIKDPARDEMSESCGHVGVDPSVTPPPTSSEIPRAYFRENATNLLGYVGLAVLFGPWAVGVFVVWLAPAGMRLLRSWPTAADD